MSAAAQLLIWARRGVLPPTISLEGDPIQTMLHIRGPFWLGGGADLGWMPCIYSMQTQNAECGTSAADANRRGWEQYNRSRPHVRLATLTTYLKYYGVCVEMGTVFSDFPV